MNSAHVLHRLPCATLANILYQSTLANILYQLSPTECLALAWCTTDLYRLVRDCWQLRHSRRVARFRKTIFFHDKISSIYWRCIKPEDAVQALWQVWNFTAWDIGPAYSAQGLIVLDTPRLIRFLEISAAQVGEPGLHWEFYGCKIRACKFIMDHAPELGVKIDWPTLMQYAFAKKVKLVELRISAGIPYKTDQDQLGLYTAS
jgi:hypothetical protein